MAFGIPRLAFLAAVLAFFIPFLFMKHSKAADPVLPEPGKSAMTQENSSAISLTAEERAWLREHPVIRVVQDPGWPPVEFADDKGGGIGISGDYLKLLEQRIGIKFERIQGLTWQEAYARLKRHEIDMTTSVAVTPERLEFWVFTKPYMKIPIAIFTQRDVTYISNMRELSGKKVAIVEGYAVNDWIPRDFPDIQLVKVKNAKEGLDLLQEGKVFAYIDNMLVGGYYISKTKAMNVKIAGETPYMNAQSMAVRKDWPVLEGILQKALDSITEGERDSIYQKWVPIRYEHGFNYGFLWRMVAIFAAILLLLLAWNWKLSKEIRRRRLVEESLRKSEERFRSVVESSPMAMHFFHLEDDKSLVLTGANPAADRITGIEHHALIGKRIEEAFPGLVNTSVPAMYRKVAAGEIGYQSDEVAYKDERFGGIYEVHVFRTGQNTIVGAFFDITAQKRMEEQLRQSEKMKAIGQLAGGVAHDFNNQLSGIMGYAEMLVARLDDKTLREYAECIQRASRRSADLTRDLLAFSRKGKMLSVHVNIHKAIEEVVAILQHSLDKRIEIKINFKANPATIMGDPSQIQNVLLNLAINARDAMPTGGELVFSTENVKAGESRMGEGFPENLRGRCLKISISDTGIGMDKETVKHIFEPFFTTKEIGKGTGMGLPSAYGTVQNHHGAINVSSELGRGTVFSIYFPLVDDKAEQEIAEKLGTAPAMEANIMLVEDEELVRGMEVRILDSLGYKTIVCKDGAEAVEIYRKTWKSIDLVILDLIMPRMNGRETFLSIRKINPDVKVIVSSGFSIDGEAQCIIDMGAKGFIQKPFNIAELDKSIKDVLIDGGKS